MQRKLILRNRLSPGDIMMLTAAVRDLHKCHPGKFLTDVRTTAKALWDHNPYITKLETGDDVEEIDCHYPLIHQSNQRPYHFIHGFHQFLSEKLGVNFAPTAFKGDIHLAEKEKAWISQVEEITKSNLPFWIIVAGGKQDFTIKWWDTKRFQEVVDHFKDRTLFVQVGESGHHHPKLANTIDLRGKTNIRQFVRLMYHAQGVVCPVTFAMHLAAAVETKPGMPSARPCVVVAGGREPVQWEAYPHHRFLHTQGALPCCMNGGCWKSRTVPLGDGDPKDEESNLCKDVTQEGLPRCMNMISAEDVIRSIESYFEGGTISYLSSDQAKLSQAVLMDQENAPLSSPEKPQKVSPKKGNGSRNQIQMRIIGLRRSGLHAITNWLCGLYEGPVCYVNDIWHQNAISPERACDPLPIFENHCHRKVSLDQPKELLIVSYEDERLIKIKNHPPSPSLFGASDRKLDVLILRDPFNMIASRLQLMRKQPDNPFVKDFLYPLPDKSISIVELWKRYAAEFLHQTHHLENPKVVINFNLWVQSRDYRAGLCDALGVRLQEDETKERVPIYGFGSSFEDRTFDHKATEMNLLNRWEQFQSDPEFLELVSDLELQSLSGKIFEIKPMVTNNL